MATQDEYIKTALRLPRHLHADISVSAENSGRSMNAEIIDRLSKSSDLSHLHRVIEQLSQTMQADREGERVKFGLIVTMFEQAVEAFETAIGMAENKNATPKDIEYLRGYVANINASITAISPLSRNQFVHGISDRDSATALPVNSPADGTTASRT